MEAKNEAMKIASPNGKIAARLFIVKNLYVRQVRNMLQKGFALHDNKL
jgi:hypothetical protein